VVRKKPATELTPEGHELVPTSEFCLALAIHRDADGNMFVLRQGGPGEPRWVRVGPISRKQLLEGFLRLTPFEEDELYRTTAMSCLEHVLDGRHP
jgi:hypothetical protein